MQEKDPTSQQTRNQTPSEIGTDEETEPYSGTIFYDSSNHIRLIFSCQGTTLHRALPMSLFSGALAALIYALIKDGDYVDYDKGLTPKISSGYDYFSTLIAFMVVYRFLTVYDRLWEARNILDEVLQNAYTVAGLTATWSRRDMSPGAVKWRTLMKIRLVKYIRSVMSIVRDPDETVSYTKKKDDFDTQMRSADPYVLAKTIHELIFRHKEFIQEQDHFPAPAELKIHQFMEKSTKAYSEAVKFSTTPVPYPLMHLLKLMLLFFNLVTPGVVVREFDAVDDPFVLSFVTFLIVYGFNAIEATTVEIDDPFGSDPNDLDVKALLDGATRPVMYQLGTPVENSEVEIKSDEDDIL